MSNNSISDFEPDPGGHEAGERRPQGEAGEGRGRLTSWKKLQGVNWSQKLFTHLAGNPED